MEPREYTTEEIRTQFLNHVKSLVKYWDRTDDGGSQFNRIEGVAFSILSALDGCSMALPAFIIAPCPHPEDKEFYIEEGSNYYPENDENDVKGDIGGGLHEYFSTM